MKLVRYHNDLNQFDFTKFKEKELNIVFAIFYYLKDKKTNVVEISFAEFKKIANLDRSNSLLKQSIRSINKKMISLYEEIIFENGDEEFRTVFDYIKIKGSNSSVVFAVKEEYQYMFNDLFEQFTKFDLKIYTSLKYKYCKHVFRWLKQFDHEKKNVERYWVISVSEFKKKIGLSSGYGRSDFSKLLKNVKNELKDYFDELEILKLNSSKKIISNGEKTIFLKFVWKNTTGVNKLLENSVKEYKKKQGLKRVSGFNFKEQKANEHIEKMKIAKEKRSDFSNLRSQTISKFLEEKGKKVLDIEEVKEINTVLRYLKLKPVEFSKVGDGFKLEI